MKKVIIDLDDTITEKSFLRLVNEFLGTNYTHDDVKGYFVNDLIPEERMEEWIRFFREKNMYDYATMIDGAYEVLEMLTKKYDVYIASAYIFRDDPKLSGTIARDKFEYVIENFPFINYKNIIMINNKDMIEADIRIDDNISNLKGKAEKKILFTAYHNKNTTDEELEKEGIIRADSWKEIEKILLGGE